jgi:Uncharacterized protein conserved in bacteria (DUF2188)
MDPLGADAQISVAKVITVFGVATMSGIQRRDGPRALEIAHIREALGAVAAGEPAVFWVYRRRDGQWAARREGALSEKVFDSREAAEADVEALVARCRSYRLFIEGQDGTFTEENAGWPAAMRQLITDNA